MKKEYSVNKYQFGTVMPGTQPVAFQYQPLGLEAFAQPIAQKQRMFDVTLDAVDSASFKIDGLDVDKESSNKLNAELVEQKNFLMQQLQETGNSKEIARRLKKLNKVYNSDGEISGIRQQKANFLAEATKQRERIDGDKFTQKMYNEWEKKALYEYTKKGGYNYDRSTGKHGSINVTPRGDNLETEFMELAMKLAKDAGDDSTTKFQRTNFKGLEEAVLQAKSKSKNADEVASEIYNFMTKSDRYQTYLDETAEYEFFNINQGNANSENIRIGIERMEKAFDSEISSIDAQIDKTNDKEKKKELQNKRKQLEESKLNIQKTEEETMLLGEDSYYDFAENAYAATFSSEFQQDISNAAGNVVAETDLDISYKIPGEDNLSTQKTDLQEIVNNEQVTVVALSNQATSVEGVEGTSIRGGEEGLGTDYNVYEAIKDEESDKTSPENEISKLIYNNQTTRTVEGILDNLNGKNISEIDRIGEGVIPENEAVDFKATKYSAIRVHGVLDTIEKYNDNIAKQDAIILKNTKNLKGASIEEKAKYNAAIGAATRKKVVEGQGYEAAMLKLNNSMQELSTKTGNEWMSKAFDKNGYEGIYQELYDRNLNKLKKYEEGSKNLVNDLKEIVKKGSEQYTYKVQGKNTGTVMNVGLTEAGGDNNVKFKTGYRYNKNLTKDLIEQTKGKDYFTDVEDENVKSANLALKNFQWNKFAKNAIVPKGVQVNKESNEFTKNRLQNIIDLIAEQGANSDVPIRQVNYTGADASYINQSKQDLFNLKNYSKVPILVGQFDIEGNGVISNVFKYARMSKTDDLSIKKAILSSKGIGTFNEANLETVESKEITSFKNNNPKDLYLSMAGTSDDIVQEARNNYSKNAKEAIDLNDVTSFNSTIGSMAALDALTYKNIKPYASLATSLSKMLSIKDTKDVITQTPAIWNNVGNGDYQGYSIDYVFDKEEGIKAQVSLTTVNENTNEKSEVAVNTFIMSKIDPQTLRGMDMIYGTGSSENIINDEDGNPFIPVFRSESLSAQYNNN